MRTSSSTPSNSVILLATHPLITSQLTLFKSTFRSYSFGNLRVFNSLASLLRVPEYTFRDLFLTYKYVT